MRGSSRPWSTALVAAALVVLGLDVLAVGSAVSHYRDERRAALDEVRSEAAGRAELMNQLMLSTFDQLQTLASRDQIRTGDPGQVNDALSMVDPSAMGFTGEIAWTDGQGRMRAITGQGGGLVDVAVGDRDWVAAGLEGDRLVGSAVVSRVLNRPVVPIAVPIRDEGGTVNGVLSGGVLLERSGRMLAAVSAGPDVLVVDRSGQVIMDDGPAREELTPPAAAWPPERFAEPGSAVMVTDPLGRVGRVVAWSPVPSAGWAVVISAPADTLFGGARRGLFLAVAAVAATALALLGGAFLLVRRLSQKDREVQAAAERARAEQARTEAMAEAMARLAAAETLQEVAGVVTSAGLPWFGARAAGMSVIDDEDPQFLVNLASEGWTEEDRRGWRRFRFDEGLPVGDAVINARTVFITGPELLDRYPVAAPSMLATGDAAWAILPLMVGRTPIGTLSASFTSPATLDAETRLGLGLFAERISNAVTRVRRHEAEHDLAAAFQRAVIPEHLPAIRGVQVEGHYAPASTAIGVGGDWYDAIRISEHQLMVVCGDVVGHGLAAAAAASRLRVATATLAPTHRPAALLEALDPVAARDDDARCSSLICLLVDSVRRVVEYSVAGHPAPVMVRRSASPEELVDGRGPLLGITQHRRPTGWVAWDDDCRSLVVYTDGLIERRDEPFDAGVERLLAACDVAAPDQPTARGLADLLTHDERIDDDITAVLVHLDASQLQSSGPGAQRLPGLEFPHPRPVQRAQLG